MRVYPAAEVIRPRGGGKPLSFRPLRHKNGLLEIRVGRLDRTKIRTAKPSASSLVAARRNRRNIMEFHRVLRHPSREITRETARMTGVQLSGTWSSCINCSEYKVRRYTVPMFAESRTDRYAGRIFVDISGPFNETSFGGNRFAMLFVDDCTRFIFFLFLRH